MIENEKDAGKALRKVRMTEDVVAYEVADKIGLSSVAYSHMEKGKANFGIRAFIKALNFLGYKLKIEKK
jgi:transcriptional regulator with XRE-family HTH domain